MTLAPPPVVEDYFSLTPLIIQLCEEFTACPVKCSSPLDTWGPRLTSAPRREALPWFSDAMHSDPAHVPELAVTDCEASLIFWRDHLGFLVLYARPAEGFAYLTLGTAHLMLDQIGLGRTWEVAPLTPSLGRGINLQVSVPDLDAPLERLTASGWPFFMAPEEKWYQVGDQEAGVHQFLVQDPDGYLVRVQSSLGRRPVSPGQHLEQEPS